MTKHITINFLIKIVLYSVLLVTTTILFAQYQHSPKTDKNSYLLMAITNNDFEQESNIDIVAYINNLKYGRRSTYTWIFLILFPAITLFITLYPFVIGRINPFYYISFIIIYILAAISFESFNTLKRYGITDFQLITIVQTNPNANIALIENILVNDGDYLTDKGNYRLIKSLLNSNITNKKPTNKLIKIIMKRLEKPKWIYKTLKINTENTDLLCLNLSKGSGLYTTKAIKEGLCNGIY